MDELLEELLEEGPNGLYTSYVASKVQELCALAHSTKKQQLPEPRHGKSRREIRAAMSSVLRVTHDRIAEEHQTHTVSCIKCASVV